jgi:hypothetical protein
MCNEADVADLRRRVEALEVALAAEREVGSVVAAGHKTIPAIAAALRNRGDLLLDVRGPGRPGIHEHPADVERRIWLGQELHALAQVIEEEEKS